MPGGRNLFGPGFWKGAGWVPGAGGFGGGFRGGAYAPGRGFCRWFSGAYGPDKMQWQNAYPESREERKSFLHEQVEILKDELSHLEKQLSALEEQEA